MGAWASIKKRCVCLFHKKWEQWGGSGFEWAVHECTGLMAHLGAWTEAHGRLGLYDEKGECCSVYTYVSTPLRKCWAVQSLGVGACLLVASERLVQGNRSHYPSAAHVQLLCWFFCCCRCPSWVQTRCGLMMMLRGSGPGFRTARSPLGCC